MKNKEENKLKENSINNNINININEDSQNFNEDTINKNDLKRNNSIFEIIEADDMDDDIKEKKEEDKGKMPSLMKMKTIGASKPIPFWETVKGKINNFKNKIIFNYNIFTGGNNVNELNKRLGKTIQIFDEKFSDHEKFINKLKNIPWFSYRKNFDVIEQNGKIFSTDAGWGCMLRSSQMILAQGLCKLSSIDNLNDFISKYFAYFYDNKIPIKYMCKSDMNKDKEKLIKKYITKFSFEYLSLEKIKGLENMSDRYKDIKKEYITSPYSIRNLIKVESYESKGLKAGEWFSNTTTLRLFSFINKDMFENNDCDFKIINFPKQIIYIEEIINNCFEEEKANEMNNVKNEKENLSVNDILKEKNSNDDIENKSFIFNDKKYILKNKFIIFVSIRQGLNKLNAEVYDKVLNVFDIPTNIGIIGGNNTKAYYFIGKCDKNIIFLDPHFVQKTISLEKIGTNEVIESYIPRDIYYIPIDEVSPALSIGFAIKDMKSFKNLMKKLMSKDYYFKEGEFPGNNEFPLFEVRNYQNK